MSRAPGDDLHRQLISAGARGFRAAWLTLLTWSGAGADTDQGAQAVNAAEALELPTVTVVGTTPLPGLQLTVDTGGQHANQLTLGATDDAAHTRFRQLTQDAAFTADRESVGTGAFMPVTDADTRNDNLGLFVADAYHLGPRWTLTASGRYDRAAADISDRSARAPQLDGTHVFTRFNPAAGANFNPHAGLTLYAGYSEGMRAPTAVELSCAAASAPCQLPNDFVADPPLAAEVARTLELGARAHSALWQWSAAAYQSRLSNDIEFTSAGAANAGYFANIGAARRTGAELAASTHRGALVLAARYSFIDATFRSGFSESSPFNSSASGNGAIVVAPGDRIPSIPRHTFKLRAEYDPGGGWSLGTNLLVSSGVYARGDENNADRNGPLPARRELRAVRPYQQRLRCALL